MGSLLYSIEGNALYDIMNVVRVSIGVVFGYAGLSKLASFRGTISSIEAYGFIPGRVVPTAAFLLIFAELAISFSHLSGFGLRVIVLGSLALLAVLFLIVLRLLVRGEVRPCLCFGAHRGATVGASSLVRITLLALGEFLLFAWLWYIVGGDIGTTLAENGIENTQGSFFIGVMVVAVLALCFSLTGLRRAWYVVRS